MKQKIFSSAALLMFILLLAAPGVFAQAMKYKVGDRVEVDGLMSSDPRNAKYKKATIVGIDDANPADKAYIVTLDDSPTHKARYIVRDYTKHWIRDIQGGDAGAKPDAGPDTAIKTNPGDANQPGPANAQPQGTKYKEGDRVEVDIITQSNPANAKWQRATITKVDTGTAMAYTVQVDPAPGQLPEIMHIPIRPYAEGWLRPLGGAAPIIDSDKLRVDDHNTVLADREILDCKNLKAGPARNGQPPPTDLIKKLIRCTFERPSDPGQDGARTMDIASFVPAGSRRWDLREDQGMHATADTIVYTFQVKYDKKAFYRTYTQTETGGERNFNCYVDGTEWYCGTAAGNVKDGQKKMVPVQK